MLERNETNKIIQKVANYYLCINAIQSWQNSKLDVGDFQRFSATPIYSSKSRHVFSLAEEAFLSFIPTYGGGVLDVYSYEDDSQVKLAVDFLRNINTYEVW